MDDNIEFIDVLKLEKLCSDYSGEIKGIVFFFGGKCFDIILVSREVVVKLVLEGIDYK